HYWKADVLPTQRVLDFATTNGAKALGFDCGSLKVCNLSDIIILERGPNLYPENDIISNIVYSAGPQNVSDVIINGRLIMENRQIKTVDAQEIRETAKDADRALLR